MSNTTFRIHPAIGIARVGNSTEYYLGPETMAASPQPGTNLTGGLPIQPGTESTPISSTDLRDDQGRLKRQAARFKIYQYPVSGSHVAWPSGDGEEVTIGSVVNGKKVTDMIWTVHLANKKANCWEIDEDANLGIELYKPHTVVVDGQKIEVSTPPLRNPDFMTTPGQNPYKVDPANPGRLSGLVIDAGPRAIRASFGSASVKFDTTTQPDYYNPQITGITALPDYPVSFPASSGNAANDSIPITYLGELQTESNGRLLVLGGHGLACSFDNKGNFDSDQSLCADVDNNNWLDDTSDGPVTAVLVFEDGTFQPVAGSAWVVATDPAYAPQTLNAVTLWDDVYNTWLESFALQPEIYQNGYQSNYKPYFPDDVFPTLNAAHMQRWNTNLPASAVQKHRAMRTMTEEKPGFDVLSYIRNPDGSQNNVGSPLMPLSLGDANQAFLTLSRQQYFFLQQWNNGMCVGATPQKSGPGEILDKTILVNCLGGRFSPGIDLTFIVRDPDLYQKDWQNPEVGPFRINGKALDYSTASKGKPFLGVGYTPLRTDPVEPGDLCKFMAIPWHTDYNSCATHVPDPNPGGPITEENVYSGKVNTTLFWSWPAQRPVAVYTFQDLQANNGDLTSTPQRYSVRGAGTAATAEMQNPGCPPPAGFDAQAMNVGRFQDRRNMLAGWSQIGVVIQGPAIEGYPDGYDPGWFLEVQSLFVKDESNAVQNWPNTVTDPVFPPKP